MTGPTFRTDPVRVRTPATSANLGPGFDALGLALALYDEVEVRVVDRGITIEVTGEGADELPRDEEHLVARAMLATFDALGGRPPGLALRCVNRIPHARGLGSSAAAVVAGVLAARALVAADGADATLDDTATLRFAAALDGHPDNVAPCLLGGLTIAWTVESGMNATNLVLSDDVSPVVFVAAAASSTATARDLLPERVPHADAAANASRAALLVHALAAAPDLLLPATEDRLHQDYRTAVMPRTAEFLRHLRAGGVPAVVSGAGPSVLALASRGNVAELTAASVPGFTAHRLPVDVSGAQVFL